MLGAVAWLALLLLPGCSESEPAADAPVPPAAVPESPSLEPPPPESSATALEGAAEPAEGVTTSWVLEEFDWGDSEEIVRESIDYAPGFLCFKFRNECRVVRVKVDAEELLARFQYYEDGLWRVALLTPPLSAEQASKHGPRVVGGLADHVKRQHGEPARETPFPAIAELGDGTHVLQHWKSEAMVIEVVIVRRGSQYFVGAYFADPVRGAEALRVAADPTDPPEKPKRRAPAAMP
jgi:hypothetical protein